MNIDVITITYLCNIYPLISHFYKENLGCTVVYLFFLFLAQNIVCGYSLEFLRVPTIYVLSKGIENIKLVPMKFSIFTDEKESLCKLHGHVFVICIPFVYVCYL